MRREMTYIFSKRCIATALVLLYAIVVVLAAPYENFEPSYRERFIDKLRKPKIITNERKLRNAVLKSLTSQDTIHISVDDPTFYIVENNPKNIASMFEIYETVYNAPEHFTVKTMATIKQAISSLDEDTRSNIFFPNVTVTSNTNIRLDLFTNLGARNLIGRSDPRFAMETVQQEHDLLRKINSAFGPFNIIFTDYIMRCVKYEDADENDGDLKPIFLVTSQCLEQSDYLANSKNDKKIISIFEDGLNALGMPRDSIALVEYIIDLGNSLTCYANDLDASESMKNSVTNNNLSLLKKIYKNKVKALAFAIFARNCGGLICREYLDYEEIARNTFSRRNKELYTYVLSPGDKTFATYLDIAGVVFFDYLTGRNSIKIYHPEQDQKARNMAIQKMAFKFNTNKTLQNPNILYPQYVSAVRTHAHKISNRSIVAFTNRSPESMNNLIAYWELEAANRYPLIDYNGRNAYKELFIALGALYGAGIGFGFSNWQKPTEILYDGYLDKFYVLPLSSTHGFKVQRSTQTKSLKDMEKDTVLRVGLEMAMDLTMKDSNANLLMATNTTKLSLKLLRIIDLQLLDVDAHFIRKMIHPNPKMRSTFAKLSRHRFFTQESRVLRVVGDDNRQ